jgi:hypothetical protein
MDRVRILKDSLENGSASTSGIAGGACVDWLLTAASGVIISNLRTEYCSRSHGHPAAE